ncbi:helicase SNF2 [Williamsia sp. 1135]|nr:helicase SNF2 [Williamsia sp. 1135]
MVLDLNWDEDKEFGEYILYGSCAGSTGETYATEVAFSTIGPHWEIETAICSCPVNIYCKHAVALLLTFATVEEGNPAVPQAKQSWEALLAPILAESTPTSTGRSLALLVVASHEKSRYGNDLSVSFRPMTVGKKGTWIRSGISWRNLQNPDYRQDFNAEHYSSLQSLLEAWTRGRASYGYSPPEKLALYSASESVWAGLDSVVAAGVPLVLDRSSPVDQVDIGQSAHMGMKVVPGDQEGTARAEVDLTVDGQAWDLASVYLAGSPKQHGVYRIDERVLTLAPFRPSPPKSLLDLARTAQVVEIPAADAARFSAEVLPVLRSSMPVQVADGLFAPPEISGPVAVLSVTTNDDGARVSWTVRYVVNDQHQDFDPNSRRLGTGHRNGDAEDVLWKQHLDVLRNVAGSSDSWQRQAVGRLGVTMSISIDADSIRELEALRSADSNDAAVAAASVRTLLAGVSLSPVEAARFYVEVVPELAGRDDLLIELTENSDAYRKSEAAPQLSFSAPDADRDGNDWFDLQITATVEGEQVPLADLIRELTVGASHMLLPSGTYFPLDAPELVRLVELLEEGRALGEIESGQAKASSYNVTLWEELLALGVVDEQTRAWQDKLTRLRSARPPHDAALPEMLRADLRDYQQEGFNWLTFLWDNGLGGVLADDMGLGKTLQTLALIGKIWQSGEMHAPFLVVAPTSVIANWAAECEKFTPELTAVTVTATEAKSGRPLSKRISGSDIVITSYTLLRIDFDVFDAVDWAGLILDEAQFVKNHNAKAHQCARRLAAPFKLAITGTPMENNLMELWSLLSITAPGLFARPQQFTDYFRKPIESGTEPERLATLRRRIKPMMLRRTKDQVAGDLPPKQEQVVPVVLATKHQKIYDTRLARERQKVLGLLGDWEKNRFEIFRSLTMLRQLSLHAGLVDQSKLNLPSAKIDFLIEQLPELIAEGHSALVFSQFTGFLAIIRAHLDAAGIPYSYLDGSLSARQRATAIKEFTDGGVKVFLISLKAGGFGLNLTEADYCFVCDPWWNPAAEAQAVDRTHRIGQTRPVTVYRLVSAGTIEEKVVALQDRKRELFTAVMDEGEMFGSAIGADDIRELLGVSEVEQ